MTKNEFREKVLELAKESDCHFIMVAYSDDSLSGIGKGCIACSVRAFAEWLSKALGKNQIVHKCNIDDELVEEVVKH